MKTLRQATIQVLSIAGLLSGICIEKAQAQIPNCAVAFPYQEGFNSATMSNCFTQQQVSSATSSYDVITPIYNSQSPTIQNPYEGSHMLRFRSSFIPDGIKRRLVSSPFNTTNAGNINVSFQWYEGNPNNSASNDYPTEGVQVQYSYDGTTWHNAGNFISRHSFQSVQWSSKSITLPASAEGQSNVYIGFLFSSNNGFNCYLDALNITATTGNPATTCNSPIPTAVTAIGTNTAQVNWTASNSQYAELYYSQNNIAPTATTAATQSNLLNNQYTLTNLNANTTYYTWIRSYCTNNTFSAWAVAPVFTTLCNTAQQPNAGSIQGNDQLCTGSTGTLTATVPGGTWSSSNTSVASINTSGILTANNTGTATITYSVSNGCGTATATKMITVLQNNPLPNIAGNENVCTGTQVAYTNANAGGTWESLSPNTATITNTGMLTALQPGTVTIKYTKAQTCGTTSVTKNITITAKPKLDGIIAQEAEAPLKYNFEAQNVQYASAYLWDFGDGQTSSSMNPSHEYATAGNYQVTLCVTNNCQQSCNNPDNYKQYNLDIRPTSILTKEQQQSITIFPNPAKDKIEWQNHSQEAILSIELLDLYGRCVARIDQPTPGLSSYNTSGMTSGIYLIKFIRKSQTSIHKLVIQH